MNKKTSCIKKRLFVISVGGFSGGDAGAGGAHVGAGSAVLALGGVDDVETVTFGDGVLGAFGFAGAAADAVGRYLVCHVVFLSVVVWNLQSHRIAPQGVGVNGLLA